MAISGLGLGLATAGGVLVYAGLTHQNPLAAIRSLASGKPTAVADTGGQLPAAASSSYGGYVAAGAPSPSGGVLPQLVSSAYLFQSDKYSQAKRWQNGFSDCSSFVGKAFRGIGITPPGASVTGSYLTWSKLKKIAMSDVGAGDLLCNSSHVVICINSTTAIGQENPTRNVRIGTFSDLMAGTGSYVALRYTGTVAVQGPGL